MIKVSEILKSKSVDETIDRINSLLLYQKQTKGFIKCMTDMVIKCTHNLYHDKSEPSLKSIWKWIKAILRNYMIAKRQLTQQARNPMKNEMFSTFSPDTQSDSKGFSFGRNTHSFRKK